GGVCVHPRALSTTGNPVVRYNALVVFAGDGSAASFLHVPLFTMRMIKGAECVFSRGDLIILIAMGCLFVELIKSTYTSAASLFDHGLSLLVFIVCIIASLLVA